MALASAKIVRRSPLFAASLCLASGNLAAAVPENDTQSWSEIDAIATVTPQTVVIALSTVRLGEKLPNPTLYGGGLLAAHTAGPWTLTGGAIFATLKSATAGKETKVELPLAALTYSHRFSWATISDRNRVEQLDGIAGTPWRYRNQLLIDLPTRNFGRNSHILIADETFYDFSTSRWNRNRAQVGIGLPVHRSIEVQVFYLRQDTHWGLPKTLNVLGTTFVISL